jgi:2-dehydropantoate 2-reductase
LAATHEPQPFTHVAIIGPGAIGCMLAVRLARAGPSPRVTLIDHRPDRAERLSVRPIVLHAPEGDLAARVAVRVVPDEPADLVILATKAYAVRAAACAAAGWIGRTPLLAIQNGLGVAEELVQALPRTTVITGVMYQAANRIAEDEVHHAANLRTHLGIRGRTPDETVKSVAALFEAAGLPAVVETDIASHVWGKAVVNAALNPVAALAGVRNGDVAVRPALRAMAEAIAAEGEAAARAEGVGLPYASAAAATIETARATAENRCSMLQDLQNGRPTEIEYLNGAIVRVAERHGLASPANRAVATLVRAVSAARRKAS